MNKFTIFSIILAICVITAVVDLAVRDYFDVDEQAASSQTSVLQAEEQENFAGKKSPEIPKAEERPQAQQEPQQEPAANAAFVAPAVPQTPSSPSAVTQSLINEAGFNVQLLEEHFDGKVFQLLDITKHPVNNINFYTLSQGAIKIASITEIELSDEIRALQLYILLQNKTKPYIDLSLNETNAYGDRSFYINHAKKPDEAFLTVKIGKRLYAFAYLKTHHPTLKNLIQLLSF